TCNDAASRKAAAIACQLHVVDHWDVAHPGQEEITVQRVGHPLGTDGECRGLQPLPQNLTAEQRPVAVDWIDSAAKQVRVELLDLEHLVEMLRRRRHLR